MLTTTNPLGLATRAFQEICIIAKNIHAAGKQTVDPVVLLNLTEALNMLVALLNTISSLATSDQPAGEHSTTHTTTVYLAGCDTPEPFLQNPFELDLHADKTLDRILGICKTCREEDELNSSDCTLEPIALQLTITAKPVPTTPSQPSTTKEQS